MLVVKGFSASHFVSNSAVTQLSELGLQLNEVSGVTLMSSFVTLSPTAGVCGLSAHVKWSHRADLSPRSSASQWDMKFSW